MNSTTPEEHISEKNAKVSVSNYSPATQADGAQFCPSREDRNKDGHKSQDCRTLLCNTCQLETPVTTATAHTDPTTSTQPQNDTEQNTFTQCSCIDTELTYYFVYDEEQGKFIPSTEFTLQDENGDERRHDDYDSSHL